MVTRVRSAAFAALVSGCLLLMGCQPDSFTYDSRAIILEVMSAENSVMLHHEPIQGFMPEEMRMSFPVSEGVDLNLLSAGDKIAFTVTVSDAGVAITDVERLPANTSLEIATGGMAGMQSMVAGGGHQQHSGAGGHDRAGFTTHVSGLSGIDPTDPPSGSPVGRALAFVSDTYVHIAYSRPYKRGRVIFGGLVGYNQIWPLGAHHATEITLTGPLMVGDQRLEAGTYAFFATPGPDTWTLHFNSILGMHMADLYDAANDVLTVEAPVETLNETIHQHTIDFEPSTMGIDLRISWDQTRVRLPLRPM